VDASGGSSVSDSRAAVVDWPRFVALVRQCERFLLTTHVRPDCDALGSTLAMAAILEQLGKSVSVVTAFDVPPRLGFLDPAKKIQRLGRDVPGDRLPAFDLLMVLDTSAWAQLGEMGDVIRATAARKAVLDHHMSADDLGAEFFRDTRAEATGRLVCDAAGQLGATITPPIATLLFAALATDTGWFRFSSTSAGTYRLASRLIEAGARPDQMYRDLYENESLARLRLLGRTMARTESDLGGRLVYAWITQADFAATGALPSDSEDLINMTLAVGGAEAAVILVEQPAGGFKVSFRSRCGLDCSRVAEQFGGGGHKAAAGAFVADPLEPARAKVLDAVRAAMR
jgi:bifunctional oligoribonuclease and PAP phosphatase NrnA